MSDGEEPVGPGTAAWEEGLRALAAQYVAEAAGRLDDLRRALAGLEREATDDAALQEVRRLFHAFAGSGGSYGFPRVSQLGLEGERLWWESTSPPDRRALPLLRWRELLDELEAEFARPRGPGCG